jgi:hypothetical protein
VKWLDDKLRWFFGREKKCSRCIDTLKQPCTAVLDWFECTEFNRAAVTEVTEDELHAFVTVANTVKVELLIKDGNYVGENKKVSEAHKPTGLLHLSYF